MGDTRDRIEGTAEELGGRMKKNLGEALEDPELAAEGAATEAKGAGQKELAKSKARLKGALEEAGGAVKKTVGRAIDNEQMEVEGKAKELKGQARRDLNR
jgi:uncharacterized protein YjbJ (UPF0337 family)